MNESLYSGKRRDAVKTITFHSLIILLCLPVLSACTKQGYHSFTRETHGWVVDAATGVPLKDAIVVGSWPDIGSTYCGDHEMAAAHIHETTTNKHGEFVIPGCVKTTGIFFHSDGGLSFYKKGYFPKTIDNDPLWNPTEGKAKMGYYGPGWVWQFNGAVIELESTSGISQENIDKIRRSKNGRIVTDYQGIGGSKCHWLRMPKMVMATGHRIQKRDAVGTHRDKVSMPLVEYLVKESLVNPELCHSDPIGFLMEHVDEIK
ncbi:MAG: hypothetical protein KZQ81_04465 [Candidatus Thiodiazotropha sp. (ex Rostrolucina anterorostrata)]|nr:hypothetical protein [Candidatus Thiodiazotropha sp. (ex Rostrolucina anterorostrata)]